LLAIVAVVAAVAAVFLACRYFNCNMLPGNLSGTRKCCDANCPANTDNTQQQQ